LNSVPFIGGVSDAAVWRAIDPKSLTYLPRLTYREMIARCKQVERYIKASGKDKNDFPVMKMPGFDVFKFLGLGDGLTPSGDDFLAGMLFAIHFAQMVYARKCELLPNIVNSVLQNMTTRTNQISRHFLHYASEGLWGRATEQFMTALFGFNDDVLYCAVKEKMAYGATSGIDEMSGIMSGLCEFIRIFEEG